jgi:hypothetical protein
MAKVYQVNGSEDGVLGIYGNKKRAIQAAIQYVENSGGEDYNIDNNNAYITYIEGEYSSANVELFHLQ